MPKKSVREMTVSQKIRHSLGRKTFRTVIIFAVILSIAAILFSIILYWIAVTREFRTEAWHLSRIAAATTERSDVVEKTRDFLAIYESIPEEERQQKDSIEYQKQYTKEKDFLFSDLQYHLHVLERENEAASVYIAALDPETNRLIYLIDSDTSAHFCPPGYWDELSQQEFDSYINGEEIKGIRFLLGDRIEMPSVINYTEEYGNLCTSATYLYTEGKYYIMAFADLDMEYVLRQSRLFFIQYVVLMVAIGLILGTLITMRLRRRLVAPINSLAEAVTAYSSEKQPLDSNRQFFDQLQIHTGDELENLSLVLQDMEHELNDYMTDLMAVTSERERISTELDVARQIQEGMIPHLYPAFPGRPEFDIYATMQPAKEVGGDFYDYFLIDEDHLALVMADVSGKGIPAALFMMASKILIGNYSKIQKFSPAEILQSVNEAVCSNNPAEMFVTVWLGILEISTGILKAANAGHEYPIVRKSNGLFELYKEPHSLVIGGLPGVVYKEYEIRLESGDCIFQYTDGVTEATNSAQVLFGVDRMIRALNVDPAGDPEEILGNVMAGIDAHVDGADQFDDITMLCMKYYTGSVEVKELELEATRENLPQVITFIESALEKIDCPMKEMMQLNIAAEEIYINIANYAYTPRTGKVKIRLVTSENPSAVSITFIDSGRPYNPLEREDPDVTLSAEERQIGGLGIYMVKQSMDNVSYRYEDGQNILILKKKLQGKDNA